MPISLVFLVAALVGLLLAAAGWLTLGAVGARPALARRLAGPPQVGVGRLSEAGELGARTLRVEGRIRCREPLELGDGERLVAYHRDVEVRVSGRWRTVERMRETRSFELWDHDGSLAVDPARAAEPLVTIPKVWRGQPTELEEPHTSSVARLVERHGPATAARATVRTINVTDRLLVLARPVADDERGGAAIRLEPPEGGYVITNLPLADAMRLLGGGHRRTAAGAVIALALGIGMAAIGVVGTIAATLLGR